MTYSPHECGGGSPHRVPPLAGSKRSVPPAEVIVEYNILFKEYYGWRGSQRRRAVASTVWSLLSKVVILSRQNGGFQIVPFGPERFVWEWC